MAEMDGKFATPVENWSIARLLKAVTVPDKYRAGLRDKQLHTVGNMTSVIMLANLVSLAVVLQSFRGNLASYLLSIWGVCLVFIIGLGFLGHIRARRDLVNGRVNERHLDSVVRGSMINGLFWAAAPLLVMSSADPLGQMVMGIVLVGMMFAGAFLLSRIPEAAFSFIIPIAAGLIVSMQIQPNAVYHYISVLTIVYLSVLIFAVRWSHLQFVEQHLSEAGLTEQSQLIGLLLRDFEESTSDWLWQTSAEGVLEDIPLVVNNGSDAADFMKKGEYLLSLFQPGEARKMLETVTRRQQGFKDIVLEVRGSGEDVVWVSLTGKPIFEEGVFRGFRGVAADITQSKQIEDRIAHMAHHDGLTGLPNRSTLQEHLEKLLRRAPSPNRVRALLWMDLDNFKWVNDALGHLAGDELLRQVTTRLRDVCEAEDVVARLGGDEFALLVERPAGGALEAFINRVTECMQTPYNIWGSTAYCSASLGVRQFDPFTTDSRLVLKHADLALYDAKKTGKAQWRMFTADLEVQAQIRVQTEAELEAAIDRDELRVYFQPLVDARTHKMIGAEALLRWQHPTRGLIFPDQFIELAENNGLITRMGEWVIRAALAEAARLPDHVKVAVNISPLQIYSATLVSTIVNALDQNRIAPNRLELEIAESVLMTDTQFTQKRLHQIKDLGVRIALDDFGTGYSSLSYLRAFPFDKIKIDKTFVKDIETRPESRAITVATLNLAKSLGLRCTAEGVETLYQADFLRDQGCDELQGFFISRAQPLDRLAHIVDVRPSRVVVPALIETVDHKRMLQEPNVLAFTAEKRA